MRAWTIIQNDKQYAEVMDRIGKLSLNPPALESDQGKELFLLGYLADKYETEKFRIAHPDPIDAIRIRMEELHLKVSELNAAFGDRGTASKVLSRKRPLSLNMIRHLSKQLELPTSLLIMPVKMPGRNGNRPDKTKSKKIVFSKKNSSK